MRNTDHHEQCQWIGQDNTQPSCLQPTVNQKSYCCHHVWTIYQKGSAVKGRRKDRRALTLQDLIDDLNAAYDDYLIEEFS